MVAIDRILELKRDGFPLEDDQIRAFIEGLLSEEVTRAQAAAFLAFAFVRGMSDRETVALTVAMTETGDRLSWPGIEGPFVDKHSTGGVGDKVSLVLAPVLAELGYKVPMLSGRGLGITGGTLDKLEAIPGYRTDLDDAALRRALVEVGCFINGQTARLAPADRILYALRNEICTVPSVPLITASILSKKLSEGIERLVLDVKFGSGAFMPDREAAVTLAESLVRVGTGAGLQVRAVLSDMNTPLGRLIGNALEVEESIACLRGEGPADLEALVCDLAGDPRALGVLRSGAALPRFEAMVRAHGGDPTAPLLGGGCAELPVLAEQDGVVTRCDAGKIGRAAFVLGAGRTRADEPVHPGVGLRLLRKPGEQALRGEPLAIIVHAAGRGLDEALALTRRAYEVGP